MRGRKGQEKGELSRIGVIRVGILGEAGPEMTIEAVMETGRVSGRPRLPWKGKVSVLGLVEEREWRRADFSFPCVSLSKTA